MEQDNSKVCAGKIIKLPYCKVVSDDDISALFSGLVRLVKQNAMSKSEKMYSAFVTKLKKEIALLKLENKILQGDVK